MAWRNHPMPIGLPPEDAFYHVIALATDPIDRRQYERVELYTGMSIILATDHATAVSSWDAALHLSHFHYQEIKAMNDEKKEGLHLVSEEELSPPPELPCGCKKRRWTLTHVLTVVAVVVWLVVAGWAVLR